MRSPQSLKKSNVSCADLLSANDCKISNAMLDAPNADAAKIYALCALNAGFGVTANTNENVIAASPIPTVRSVSDNVSLAF